MNQRPGESLGSPTQQARPIPRDPDGGVERGDEGIGAANESADGAMQQAGQIAEQGKERVAQAAEMGEERAADGMERAADMVRDRADAMPVGSGMAVKAADGMERSAHYLRERDTSQMWGDVEQYVRDHPVMGIAGSVAAGFLVGRMLR